MELEVYTEEDFKEAKEALCFCASKLFRGRPCDNCSVINRFIKKLKMKRIDKEIGWI
jgi:hypothetical protein